eukprot:141744-Chlamydomonas_euryale.AAC.1
MVTGDGEGTTACAGSAGAANRGEKGRRGWSRGTGKEQRPVQALHSLRTGAKGGDGDGQFWLVTLKEEGGRGRNNGLCRSAGAAARRGEGKAGLVRFA